MLLNVLLMGVIVAGKVSGNCSITGSKYWSESNGQRQFGNVIQFCVVSII